MFLREKTMTTKPENTDPDRSIAEDIYQSENEMHYTQEQHDAKRAAAPQPPAQPVAGDVAMPADHVIHNAVKRLMCHVQVYEVETETAKDDADIDEADEKLESKIAAELMAIRDDALAQLAEAKADIRDLLAHIEDVVSEYAWSRISVAKWNKVSTFVASADAKVGAQAGPVLLTDEQIDVIAESRYGEMKGYPLHQCRTFVRAIEAVVHAANPTPKLLAPATAEQIDAAYRKVWSTVPHGQRLTAFAREIEAAHGIKAASQEGGAA